MLCADKKKIQELANQQRIDLADVAVLDLDHVNSILASFTNPQEKRFAAMAVITIPRVCC